MSSLSSTGTSKRSDGRAEDQVRSLQFQSEFQLHPAGSVLVQWGQTRIICSVSPVDRVPRWMQEQNQQGGWLTAEYDMLPGATGERSPRNTRSGGPSGRSQEIQRLIGRSLRAVVDLANIGRRTLYVDCDVLDADGGTRCAAISGASVALSIALEKLLHEGEISKWPMLAHVGAISTGIVGDRMLLDLCYEEDSQAEVDMNVIMTSAGRIVEVQGAAEGKTFTQDQMNDMVSLARRGLSTVFDQQKAALDKNKE